MEIKDFSSLTITDVQFLPIVKEYARRINLVETINQMVNTEMDLSTKFHTVLVIKSGNQRQLAKPLKSVHLEYLKALDVKPDVFITP